MIEHKRRGVVNLRVAHLYTKHLPVSPIAHTHTITKITKKTKKTKKNKKNKNNKNNQNNQLPVRKLK